VVKSSVALMRKQLAGVNKAGELDFGGEGLGAGECSEESRKGANLYGKC